jgi:hypothetical protein
MGRGWAKARESLIFAELREAKGLAFESGLIEEGVALLDGRDVFVCIPHIRSSCTFCTQYLFRTLLDAFTLALPE